MGFDDPFMPGWTFPPAIQDIERWNGFSDKTFVPSLIGNRSRSIPISHGRIAAV